MPPRLYIVSTGETAFTIPPLFFKNHKPTCKYLSPIIFLKKYTSERVKTNPQSIIFQGFSEAKIQYYFWKKQFTLKMPWNERQFSAAFGGQKNVFSCSSVPLPSCGFGSPPRNNYHSSLFENFSYPPTPPRPLGPWTCMPQSLPCSITFSTYCRYVVSTLWKDWKIPHSADISFPRTADFW